MSRHKAVSLAPVPSSRLLFDMAERRKQRIHLICPMLPGKAGKAGRKGAAGPSRKMHGMIKTDLRCGRRL